MSRHRFPALTHGRLAATPGVADLSNVPAWCMTRRAVRRVLPEDESELLLIIDQFEEIITSHPDRWHERENFFRQLNQALLDDPNLWVVLTLREDYIAALDPYAPLLFRFFRQVAEAAAEQLERVQLGGGTKCGCLVEQVVGGVGAGPGRERDFHLVQRLTAPGLESQVLLVGARVVQPVGQEGKVDLLGHPVPESRRLFSVDLDDPAILETRLARLLSNSDVPFIRKLYKDFRIDTVAAPRAINCNAKKRGKVSEVVVRNYS